MANTNFFANLTPETTVSANHRITLRQNVHTSTPDTIWAALDDAQMQKLVEFLGTLDVQFRKQDDRPQASAPASAPAPASSSSKKKSSSKKTTGKASAPRKEREFWSYTENAPLKGSVKLADFYEVTASKSGKQSVIEVSKELAPCWWYFLNACVREYNSIIAVKDGKDADLFPLKSCGGKGERKLACDRKVVNGGAAFMFADAESSTASMNRFIEVVNGYLTKAGNTSVSKGKALYAKADAERKAEYDARKAQA